MLNAYIKIDENQIFLLSFKFETQLQIAATYTSTYY